MLFGDRTSEPEPPLDADEDEGDLVQGIDEHTLDDDEMDTDRITSTDDRVK